MISNSDVVNFRTIYTHAQCTIFLGTKITGTTQGLKLT
jgi:hypothetical protein